jgi:DNA-binding transcriptional ArsR family regulator
MLAPVMSTRASTAIAGKSGSDDAALDTIFSALSDRTRRRILARLSDGAATVGELAAPFSMSLPAVSKHIRILEDAGLLRRERSGWYHHCRLQGQPLEAAREFIDRYRSFWGETLDKLARYVETDAVAERPRSATNAGRRPHRRREGHR